MPRCSVITTVYNSSRFLSKFLLALSLQTENDFELIISDDGSTEDIMPLIDKYQGSFKNRIKYIFQDKKGVRKTLAFNKGILACGSEYLLFVDPDCLTPSNWVETHLNEREINRYLIGRRVKFTRRISEIITDDLIIKGKFSRISLFFVFGALTGQVKYCEQVLIIKSKFLRWVLHYSKSSYLMGCNFSCWKKDIEKVNGWNNEICGLGGEDVELDGRLKFIGLKPKSIKFMASVFHLFHQERKNNEWTDYVVSRPNDASYPWAESGLIEAANIL